MHITLKPLQNKAKMSSLTFLGMMPTQNQTKTMHVHNLGKAGALLIGNLLCHYKSKSLEDLQTPPVTAATDVVESMKLGIMDIEVYNNLPQHIRENRIPSDIDDILRIDPFTLVLTKRITRTNFLDFPKVRIFIHILEDVYRPKSGAELRALMKEEADVLEKLALVVNDEERRVLNAALAEVRLKRSSSCELDRPHDRFELSFTVGVQSKIRTVQNFLLQCLFKVRCHRRRMLLLACMITLPRLDKDCKESGGAALTLGSLFNDPFGGIMRQYVAKHVTGHGF
jgi:hypothetical protein